MDRLIDLIREWLHGWAGAHLSDGRGGSGVLSVYDGVVLAMPSLM